MKNQLAKDQIGSVLSFDVNQAKKDVRKIRKRLWEDSYKEKATESVVNNDASTSTSGSTADCDESVDNDDSANDDDMTIL